MCQKFINHKASAGGHKTYDWLFLSNILLPYMHCLCMCTFLCMCMRTCVCGCMRARTCVCVCVCVYACASVCACVHACVRVCEDATHITVTHHLGG